jgi:hypothetical protein
MCHDPIEAISCRCDVASFDGVGDLPEANPRANGLVSYGQCECSDVGGDLQHGQTAALGGWHGPTLMPLHVMSTNSNVCEV